MFCLDRDDTVGAGAGEAGGGGGGVGRGCGVTDLVIESCGGWTGVEIGVDIGAGESIGDMLPWVANRCSISCSYFGQLLTMKEFCVNGVDKPVATL